MSNNTEKNETFITVTTQIAKTSLLLSINSIMHVPVPVELPSKSRKLTSGEIALARFIFKDSIPYEKVRIVRGGLLGIPNHSRNAMTPYGKIHLPIEAYDVIKDFSNSSLKEYEESCSWFIHEMAHVWQYFAMDLSVACRGVRLALIGGYSEEDKSGKLMAYAYDLLGIDKGKEFKDFNIEQQADIVRHYYLVKYHTAYVLARPTLNYLMNQQANRILVLRDFLKNPLDNKLKFEELITETFREKVRKNRRVYLDAVTKVRTF